MTEEKNKESDWVEVFKILDIIKSKITQETDLLWTNYNSKEELIAEINIIDNLVREKNRKGLEALEYLFAPTGTLQEISMQNDWIQEYLNLSSKFDTLYKNLK